MIQYTHKGKLNAIIRDLNTYRMAANALEGDFDEDDSDDDEWVGEKAAIFSGREKVAFQ